MEMYMVFIEIIRNDMGKIVRGFIREDLKPLLAGIVKLPMAFARGLRDAGKKIRKDRIKETCRSTKEHVFTSATTVKKEFLKRCKESFPPFFNKIKQELDKKSGKERSVYILRVLLYFTSFLGGIYLGQAIPDQDIKYLGIGNHRNVFTHSVVPLICIKLLAKFMFRVVGAVYAKVGDDVRGKDTLVLIRNNLGAIAGGVSVGIAAHLLQDGILEPSGTIRGPGFNTLISGTTLDDQAFLVVNSFFSCLFGRTFVTSSFHRAEEDTDRVLLPEREAALDFLR